MANRIVWLTAQFLWDKALKDRDSTRFKQPAILRFDSDTFMEDLTNRLEKDPAGLKDYVARYENWTDKNAGWLFENELPGKTLKLYQPAHGFFYLVAASLICQMPGFPDRKVDAANGEKVSFVIRRLIPSAEKLPVNPKDPSTYNEYARVITGQNSGWQKAPSTGLLDWEDRLPLFSMNYTEKGRRRSLLAGLIPVANREKYQADPRFSIPEVPQATEEDTLEKDPRMPQFETRILDAMKNLMDAMIIASINVADAREVLKYTLLDVAEFLKKYSVEVWDAVLSGAYAGADNHKRNLFSILMKDFSVEKNLKWYEVLKKDETGMTLILGDLNLVKIKESIIHLGDLDSFKGIVQQALDPKMDSRLFQFDSYVALPLSKLKQTIVHMSDEQARQVFLFIILDFLQFLDEHLGNVWEAIQNDQWKGADDSAKKLFNEIEHANFYGACHWDDALREIWDRKADVISGDAKGPITSGLTGDYIKNAIDNYQKSSIYICVKEALRSCAPVKKMMEAAETDPGAGVLYFLRCVYHRPLCKNISSPVVSEPSRPFQFAPYYDPDAPGRPVRISMPVDTSISGLRKYPRNVSFLISDKLRQQMERIQGKKLNDLDTGSVGGEKTFNLGMVCSFSIPIITICALILLMIIVQLLNIIFWWLPFFRICLPLNLKAK